MPEIEKYRIQINEHEHEHEEGSEVDIGNDGLQTYFEDKENVDYGTIKRN